MKEYGGYIQLDDYNMAMYHENALALNCGRNCLAYLIRLKKIRKIFLPFFLCESIRNVCLRENVEIDFYCIDDRFCPKDLSLKDDEWIFLVNYYGQLSEEQIHKFVNRYERVIVDQTQDFFHRPLSADNLIYSCRKFFGVADGAFLYTEGELEEELDVDESYHRMGFLLGRYERPAEEFYAEYTANNLLFQDEPIKRMSKLTSNLLRAIDYEKVKERRTKNFSYLHKHLQNINELELKNSEGAFAYPLLIARGDEVKRRLISEKIYIPTLWPNVLEDCLDNSLEYRMAKHMLPLPVDQRYTEEDMLYIVKRIYATINELNLI